MADVRAMVEGTVGEWRGGDPEYVIRMIDKWTWLAHGPQMYFLPIFVFLRYSVSVLGKLYGFRV